MLKVILTVVGFLTGICAGVIGYQGIDTFLQREGYPGGEVLILPLIVFLFFGGLWCGLMTKDAIRCVKNASTYENSTGE